MSAETTTTTRECGTCRACCFVCPVESLQKPMMTPCRHQNVDGTKPGCTIYGQHPEPCRVYRCSWLAGEFGDDDRPDSTGVLFENTDLQFDDGKTRLTVLLGMVFDPKAQTRRFLQYAEKGKVVAIAGGIYDDRTHDAVAGHPADVSEWLGYLNRARENGYLRDDTDDNRASIRVNREPQAQGREPQAQGETR